MQCHFREKPRPQDIVISYNRLIRENIRSKRIQCNPKGLAARASKSPQVGARPSTPRICPATRNA